MKKWTLQFRLTAIVGVILLAACLLLTTNSLFAARTYYGDYASIIESGLVEVDPALEGRAEFDPALGRSGSGEEASDPGLGSYGTGEEAFDPGLGSYGTGEEAFDPGLGSYGTGEEAFDPGLGSFGSEMGASDDMQVIPDEFYLEASRKFSVQSFWAMAFIVVTALGCTYFATGQVLRPLKKLTASVQDVDDRHLNQRISKIGSQGEVLALTESFNGMLDRLEEAFLIQKSFTANVAHELKTPLAVIKSSLQVLEMDPHPAEADYREFMADTGESVERIIQTVEGLLALAKLDAAPVGESVELRPLLDQAARELSGRARTCGVTLTVTGQAEPVKGTSSLLYRVFFNLIDNGIKYNNSGGTVDITLEADAEKVRVRVEDTGIGIPPDVLPHIFEPFYQADPTRYQQFPGSGLGLAVVRLIVERHGGSVRAESAVGEGSVFVVTLDRQ